MAPLAFMGLGPQELIIILVIVLLLFGGSRLAGLGKSSGRALKEFKEETKGLRENKPAPDQTLTDPQAATQPTAIDGQPTAPHQSSPYQQAPAGQTPYPPVQPTPPHNLADPSPTDPRRDA
jgi:sec-independent protein translocase protein TatA